jgi:hypothetical protein
VTLSPLIRALAVGRGPGPRPALDGLGSGGVADQHELLVHELLDAELGQLTAIA